eukprot:1136902-Pelagomonas_calceolata.AAC.4
MTPLLEGSKYGAKYGAARKERRHCTSGADCNPPAFGMPGEHIHSSIHILLQFSAAIGSGTAPGADCNLPAFGMPGEHIHSSTFVICNLVLREAATQYLGVAWGNR